MSESVLDKIHKLSINNKPLKEGFYDVMCFNCNANIDLWVWDDGSVDMDAKEKVPLSDDGKTLLCYLCGVDSVVCSHSAVEIVSDMVLSMPIGCSDDDNLGWMLINEIKKKMREKFLNKSDPEPFGRHGNVISFTPEADTLSVSEAFLILSEGGRAARLAWEPGSFISNSCTEKTITIEDLMANDWVDVSEVINSD